MAEFLAFIWFKFFHVSLVVMTSKLLHVRLDLFKHFRILFCVNYKVTRREEGGKRTSIIISSDEEHVVRVHCYLDNQIF